MIYTRSTLRPVLVDILLGMGEIKEERGETLNASPDSDMEFTQLNFDSLTVLDFCLKVETRTEAVIDPDELLELESLRDLEDAIMARQAS
jgi:acyl carrier protein